MFRFPKDSAQIVKLLEEGVQLPLAIKHYPSRGQTSVQELYQTKLGKLFLKRSSKRNHQECQVNPKYGTLAEREYWAYRLALFLKLNVPQLVLFDSYTTLQQWLDFPDAHQYSTSQGVMKFKTENIFDCTLFDWLSAQIDRHDANYLYDYVNSKIILIDSGHAFLKYDGTLPDYLKVFEIAYPRELTKKVFTPVFDIIQNLSMKKLIKLVPLKNEEEKEALSNRLLSLKQVNCLIDLINLYRSKS
ncbi:MAG: hypothetical protein HYU97_02960 [Deltaproteobacteria bacterium]|nr:hypothetical protein [Deltaproteobacteria bacterium]